MSGLKQALHVILWVLETRQLCPGTALSLTAAWWPNASDALWHCSVCCCASHAEYLTDFLGLVSSYRWHVCRADWESGEPPEVSDKAVWLLPLQMVRASIPCLALLVFTDWVVQHFVAGLGFWAAFYSWHRFCICINLHRWGRVLIMGGWDFAIWSPNLTWNFLWYLKRQTVICELAAFNLILAPKVCCTGMSSLFCLWLTSKWTGSICCLRLGPYSDWLLNKNED